METKKQWITPEVNMIEVNSGTGTSTEDLEPGKS